MLDSNANTAMSNNMIKFLISFSIPTSDNVCFSNHSRPQASIAKRKRKNKSRPIIKVPLKKPYSCDILLFGNTMSGLPATVQDEERRNPRYLERSEESS